MYNVYYIYMLNEIERSFDRINFENLCIDVFPGSLKIYFSYSMIRLIKVIHNHVEPTKILKCTLYVRSRYHHDDLLITVHVNSTLRYSIVYFFTNKKGDSSSNAFYVHYPQFLVFKKYLLRSKKKGFVGILIELYSCVTMYICTS